MIQLFHIKSKTLKHKRRVFVYLPPGADFARGPTMPVMYMQDGQNLFADVCHEVPFQWELDRVATALVERGRIPRTIIVGLANTPYREYEYTHAHCKHFKVGGWADRYLDFVTDEVMPFIRDHYPVNPLRTATVFGGSSLGGLLTLYAAFTRSHAFGSFIATSPSVWWNDFSIFSLIQSSRLSPDHIRLWVDIGRREMKGLFHKGKLMRPLRIYRHLDEVLRAKGFRRGDNYRYFEERLGTHDERSWGRRMRRALPFLLRSTADLHHACRDERRSG